MHGAHKACSLMRSKRNSRPIRAEGKRFQRLLAFCSPRSYTEHIFFEKKTQTCSLWCTAWHLHDSHSNTTLNRPGNSDSWDEEGRNINDSSCFLKGCRFLRCARGHTLTPRVGLRRSTLPMLWASAAVPFSCDYTGLRRNKELLAGSHVGRDRAPLVLALAQWDGITPPRKLDREDQSIMENRAKHSVGLLKSQPAAPICIHRTVWQ